MKKRKQFIYFIKCTRDEGGNVLWDVNIVELEAYMQTDEYAEQVAKDKLGLVYEDEIIFKPEEN